MTTESKFILTSITSTGTRQTQPTPMSLAGSASKHQFQEIEVEQEYNLVFSNSPMDIYNKVHSKYLPILYRLKALLDSEIKRMEEEKENGN